MLTATPAYATVTRSHKSPSCESHVRQFFFAKWRGDVAIVAVTGYMWLLRGLRRAIFCKNCLVWLLRNGCTCRWRSGIMSRLASLNTNILPLCHIVIQCFHFEGNFPNSGKSWFFPGNFREMKKFQEIQDFGKSTKTCKKYDIYGVKKRKVLARSHKPISLWLVEGSTPKLWTIISKKAIYVNYVVQIVNFCGHLTSTLWPSSVSGNWDKFRKFQSSFQEIYFWVVETLS